MHKITLTGPVYFKQLSEELKSMNVPGYKGAACLTRDVDETGQCVLVDKNGNEVTRLPNGLLRDKNGNSIPVQETRPKKVPMQVVIKGADFSDADKAAFKAKIDAHVPNPPTDAELARKTARNQLSDPLTQAIIRRTAKTEGVPVKQIEDEILTEMVP